MPATIVMIINFLMFFLTFLYFYKKDGFTIMTFLWLYTAIFAGFSIYLCASGLYWRVVQSHADKKAMLELTPYFLNYICIFLIFIPLRKVQYSRLKLSVLKYSKKVFQLIKLILVIQFLYFLLKLYQFSVSLSYGLGNFHELGPEAQDLLFYKGMFMLQIYNYIGRFSTLIFMPFIVAYVINGFLTRKVPKRLFITVVSLFAANSIILGLTGGSRAQIFFAILNLSFFLILYKDNIDKKKIRNICLWIIFGIFVVTNVFSEIAKQRFDDITYMTPAESMYRYLGEAFPNLGYEFWDRTKFTNGKRLFENVYASFTGDRDRGLGYWTSYSGTRIYYFKTLYGDLYIDFGVYVPVLICLVLSLLMKYYLKKKNISFSKIGFIYFYFTFSGGVIFGFLSFTTVMDLFIVASILLFSLIVRANVIRKKSSKSPIDNYE